MPSKEVLSAAAHRYQARHDHRLTGDPPSMDLSEIVATKDEHVLGFAEHRRAAVHDMAERDGVEFVHETATLVDDHTVAVDGRELDADYVVVATGSTLNVPDLPGLDGVDYLDSAAVLDATELPDSGVVMGFGYVGVELVPYLAEAGVDLTVIEHDDRPLDRAHPDIGDEILDMYREEFGVEVLTNTTERRVEQAGDGVRLHVEGPDGERAVEADDLFLFTGRRPALDGLGLDVDPAAVTDTLRVPDHPTLFVPGDANGTRMVLHMAKEEGYLAADNVLADLRGEELAAYDPIHHYVMFAGAGVYPYVSVGMTVTEAREAGHDVVTAARDATDDGVFKSKDVPRGTARLVVDADDGTVLGYHGVHYHADVMAKTMQVVVEAGMDVRDVPDRAYHPTTPEILDGLFRDCAAQL